MKIFLSFLTVLTFTQLLVGCATSQPAKTLTSLDSGQKVLLTVGQNLVVQLRSNPTTGYDWNERSVTESVLEKVGEPIFTQDSAPTGMVGVGGTEIWRFNATKVGQQSLIFDYARSWETNVTPAQSVSFYVWVESK